MNKKDLHQMLSQVDEQYIAEILDADETTSENVPVVRKSRHFAGWAAMTAAVCICVAGGSLLWSRMQPMQEAEDVRNSQSESQTEQRSSAAVSTDTAVHPDLEYALIWETEAAKGISCYTWEAGGKTQLFGIGTLPFAVDSVSGYVYYNRHDEPVNVLVRAESDNRHAIFTLSDAGNFFTEYCEADLSKDENYDMPVIHIFDASEYTSESTLLPCYELYYLYNGTAMTMVTYSCTAEEAEEFAAALLRNGTTAAYIAENTSDRIAEDRGSYMFVWDKGATGHVDLAEPIVSNEGLTAHNLSSTTIPFEAPYDAQSKWYTDSFSTAYCDEDGNPVKIYLELSNAQKSVKLTADDRNFPFSGVFGSLSYSDLTREYGKPVILLIEPFSGDYHLTVDTGKSHILLETDGITAEEAEALAATLLSNEFNAADYYAQNSADIEQYDLYFQNTGDLPARDSFTYDSDGPRYELESFTLPFQISDFEEVYGCVYCTADEIASIAQVVLENSEEDTQIVITMADSGLLFEDGHITDMAGVERNGVMLYGSRSSFNAVQTYLGFTHNNTDYRIEFSNMTDKEMIETADTLILNNFKPTDLPLNGRKILETYRTLAELRTDARYEGVLPKSTIIGSLQLKDDRNLQTEFFTDSELQYTRFDLSYESEYGYLNIVGNQDPAVMDYAPENSTFSLDELTEETLQQNGTATEIDGIYQYEFFIPINNFYLNIYAKCTSEELQQFLEEVRTQ